MTKRINGRLAVLLATAAVLGLWLAGWFVLVSPQRSKVDTLNGQISDTNMKLATTQAFLRSPEAHKSIAELRRLRILLPDDVQMSDILRQVGGASAASGVRIDTIMPLPPAASTAGQTVPITLDLSGHYFRLSKFMHLLRSKAEVKNGEVHGTGRLYAVDNMSFASDKDGLINATLTLDSFVYAKPAPAPTTTGTTTGTDSSSTTTTTTTTTTTGS